MASYLSVRPLVEIARRALKTTYNLTENQQEHIFYIPLNSKKAFVEYRLSDNVYELHYTFVPDDYKGKGIGKILAEKTFDYIASRNKKMSISCDFLKNVYEKNKDKYKEYYVESN